MEKINLIGFDLYTSETCADALAFAKHPAILHAEDASGRNVFDQHCCFVRVVVVEGIHQVNVCAA